MERTSDFRAALEAAAEQPLPRRRRRIGPMQLAAGWVSLNRSALRNAVNAAGALAEMVSERQALAPTPAHTSGGVTGLDMLTDAECRRLLSESEFGRIAFTA